MNTVTAASPAAPALGIAGRLLAWLNAIPYSVLALVARAATFTVFWRSGQVKLADWSGTLSLFQDEYKVPILPPEWAAYMATSLELGCSVLVLLGLATRLSALALTGMVAVIQLFIYPMAWPDHIQWLAFMLLLIARGPGLISIDALISRVLKRS